jgi:hypothetical protein
MAKLDISKILLSGSSLKPLKLESKSGAVSKMINDTKQKQKDIFVNRAVDQEKLKMVVQL